MPEQLKYGTTRKYSLVFFFSVITVGIYYILYQYWIFSDLEEHFQKAHSTEPRSKPTHNNPITMVILWILFLPYALYMKYQLLHEHVATSSIKTEENCSDGLKALILILLLNFLTLGIITILLEARWQKVFNNHILAHQNQD
jgi:hypothetical protein